MFRTPRGAEVFKSLLSEGLGVMFSSRKSSPHFLVNIQAFPGRAISDNELFLRLEECLNAIGIQMDKGSLRVEKGGLVWVKMARGDETFSLGVTNDSMNSSPHIIITATPLQTA